MKNRIRLRWEPQMRAMRSGAARLWWEMAEDERDVVSCSFGLPMTYTEIASRAGLSRRRAVAAARGAAAKIRREWPATLAPFAPQRAVAFYGMVFFGGWKAAGLQGEARAAFKAAHNDCMARPKRSFA